MSTPIEIGGYYMKGADTCVRITAKGHNALHEINKAKALLATAEKDYATWCRVVGVMIEAKNATGS